MRALHARRSAAFIVLVAGLFLALAPRAWAASDSKGTDFWLAFPSNLGTPQLSLFITGDTDTTGTVAIPGLEFSTSFSVTAGSVTTVTIPLAAQIDSSDVVENKGIHVTALHEVTVYGLNRRSASTDAYLGLPTDILGTEYVVLGYRNTPRHSSAGTQFTVVGTRGGTAVTIVPSVTTGSRTAGVPYTITLDQGETYQLRNTNSSPTVDLSGTIVTSDKPIAVFGGNRCADIPPNVAACDHLVEQLPPPATWGRSFVTMPLATRQNGDTFRFLAATDGTTVSVNGTAVATLDRGQLHERIVDGPAQITADKPILVAQYSNGTRYDDVTSDPFMMLIPPFEQFLAGYTVTTPASGFRSNFINVVAPNAAVGDVTLDGTPIPASSFVPIGSSGFSGAQREVSLGSHTLAGPQPFGAFVYGFDEADSYGYPGGLSLAPIARVTRVALAPKRATNLINSQHCVTATVTDQNDGPLAGVRVDFSVTGANPTTGFATTGNNGQAEFCYTGANAGDDSITASVSTLSDTAAKTWTTNTPPTISDIPNQAADENAPVTVGFTVGDAQTPTGSLTVTATSSNPGLVPNNDNNLRFGGSSANRTLTVTPARDEAGTATITVTVRDAQGATATDSFVLTVSRVAVANTPPTISDIPNQTTDENAPITVGFTVGDAQTPAGSLTVTATSSDPALVPNNDNNLRFGGSGANRTLTVTPARDEVGTTTITVTVRDAEGATATDSFVLTVSRVAAANTPPTISDVSDRTINANESTGPIGFNVGDAQTPAEHLALAASSSNPTLVPDANVVLGGAGASHTVTVTPAAGQSGATTITLTVTDAQGLSAIDTFVLTVLPVGSPPRANAPPTITNLGDQRTTQSTPTRPVRFTVGDAETPAGSLRVTATSSNQRLVRAGRITLRGDGAVRSVQVAPEVGAVGRTTIVVTVSDGELSASDTFILTVITVNTTGLYDPDSHVFNLHSDHDATAGSLTAQEPRVRTFAFAPPGVNGRYRAIAGDWDGNTEVTTGLYDPDSGTFYLRNSNDSGAPRYTFVYRPDGATAEWAPIAGDWNGDGKSEVGLYDPRNGLFYLRHGIGPRAAETRFRFGPAGADPEWVPLAGDWDGDGRWTIGLYQPGGGRFHLRNANSEGPPHVQAVLAPRGSLALKPVVGDWDGDGKTTIGLYNPATGVFRLRNRNTTGPADLTFGGGPTGQTSTRLVPLAGDWNGD